MGVTHLTQEWLDRQVEAMSDLPQRIGASARVQFTVGKAPAGDVTYTQVFEDGRLVRATLGSDGDPDLAFAVTYPDAQLLARAELDLHVGFMQGRIKLVGDVGRLMDLLPATQSDEAGAAWAAVAADTEI